MSAVLAVAMAACGCCRVDRPSDEICSSALVRACKIEAARNPPAARIFGHLDGAPADEEQHFIRVARAMRSSAAWHAVPAYAAPAPVAGELRGKTERGKRALCALRRLVDDHGMTSDEIARSIAEHVAARRGTA